MSQETNTKWLQKEVRGKPFILCDEKFGGKNERGEGGVKLPLTNVIFLQLKQQITMTMSCNISLNNS